MRSIDGNYKIYSKKYCIERILINGLELSFDNENDGFYIPVINNNDKIELFLIPKYFEKSYKLKLFLNFIENLLSGGGLNKKELENEITGYYVSGCINDIVRIDIDNNDFGNVEYVKYISKKLKRSKFFFVSIPMCSMVLLIIIFLIWVLAKIFIH